YLALTSISFFALAGASQEKPPRAVPVDAVDKDGNFAPIPNPKETDTIVRVQIYLDEHMHGPGNIDGKLGEFGKKAASVYNQIRGIPIGNWHALIEAA